MRSTFAVLLACACAPTGEPADAVPATVDAPAAVDASAAVDAPAAVAEADERYLPIVWPDCAQYSSQGSQHHPFVWDRWPTAVVEDHRCRFGCTSTTVDPASWAPGIGVRLLDDGEIAIRSSHPDARWDRGLARAGFSPEIVRWTSWCGDEMTIAAHDRRVVRVVSLSRRTGEIVDEFERRIASDDLPDATFDLQLHCWDLHTAVHARGAQEAWSIDVPRHDAHLQPRIVPAEVFDRLFAPPRREETSAAREIRRTPTRVHHRVGRELFALDSSGAPLWHREASEPEIGCLHGRERMIGGSGGGPRRDEWLSTVGEYVFLDVDGGTDVFDADGTHVAYVSP